MCSIVGWVDYAQNISQRQKILTVMSESIAHRGPDGSGAFVSNNAALLHTRLAVVDASDGSQPFSRMHAGESYVISYNGELYNAGELRKQLEAKEHRFFTGCDTEVVLVSYIEWGQKCLEKFNGIFAFAIWHEGEKKLFAARDRMGVKPFFYKRTTTGLVFASELKALFKHPQCVPGLDKEGINKIFLLAPARPQGSAIYKGIKELKGGEYIYLDKESFVKKTYYTFKAKPHTDSFSQTLDKTRYLLFDAIERQLVSDAPLATFLSGGLDSSIISFIVAKKFKETGKTLSTFSVDFDGNDKNFKANSFQPDSDKKYIDIMTRLIGSQHTNVVLQNDEVIGALKAAALARDMAGMADIDASLLLFCQHVKRTHTVALSGECADEFFGGYPWYFADQNSIDTFPWARSLKTRQNLLNSDFITANPTGFVKDIFDASYYSADILSSDSDLNIHQRRLFKLNADWFMQTLLDRSDRMSMMTGLEVRVPFCDYRLVDYAYNIPWEFKAHEGREKGLLREALKNILPDDIVFRKKMPYPKTFDPLFFTAVKTLAKSAVDSGGILSQLVDKKYFEHLLTLPAESPTPWYGQLMRLPQVFGMLVGLDFVFKEYGVRLL